MNYYIQGNKDKSDQIKGAFEKLGFDPAGWDCDGTHSVYFTVPDDNKVRSVHISIGKIIMTHPDYQELELQIEPCFKVGDKIGATIYGIKRRVTIRAVDKTNRCYFGTLAECIGFSEQDQWHLVPKSHYDISNFYAGMPVLVRADNNCRWDYSVFSRITGNEDWPFAVCNGVSFTQCIPYEGNEHLLGTTDMPDERFINW